MNPRLSPLTRLLFALALSGTGSGTTWADAPAGKPHPASGHVLAVPGLLTFWDFQEPAGTPRRGKGAHAADLLESRGEIMRAEGGIFGPWSARIDSGKFFSVPRGKLGPLDIHGKAAQVTLAAWVKRESNRYWQSIAGVWDETHKKRQYMLFLNARSRTDHRIMQRVECRDLVHGHISSVGGPTPGEEFCITYASSHTPVSFDQWHLLVLSYDGRKIRVHLDGRLDAETGFNPFPYEEGIFDGGGDGAPFTVGANHVAGIENNNPFTGWIGGVAVWDRALADEEIAALAAATLPKKD